MKEAITSQESHFATNHAAIETHNSTRHDGGAAAYIHPNKILAISSERVGLRIKHNGDSGIAHKYLKDRFEKVGVTLDAEKDHYDSEYKKIQPIHHHLAHAASAFYPSGFESAGVLTVDGEGMYENGNYVSTTIWKGVDTKLKLLEANDEPNFSSQSIGLFYSGITYFLGLGFLEEGKTMGLAAYGKNSEIYQWLKKYVSINPNGSYKIDPRFTRAMFHLSDGARYFRWGDPEPEIIPIMQDISNTLGKARKKSEPINEKHRNLAWAGQQIVEDVILGLAIRTKELAGSENLCLSGGVALNSVANRRILESGLFKNVFIQPASGDEGQALGKLLYRLHNEYGIKRFFEMNNAYLGPTYTKKEIDDALEKYADRIEYASYGNEELVQEVAKLLDSQKIIGWFQQGSEMGHRALGHRSILADPRSTTMRDHINFQIKHREWFRPLAPSVLEERAPEYFELPTQKLPFMLVVCKAKEEKGKEIPAVIHVDGTGRIQTVNRKENGIYYDLIKAFGDLTGTPVVLNTSFNHAGEPIVESPEDAIKSFLAMKLDNLVIGNYLISRKE